jgi:6-pyruvoyl-tetrahydropterin synthase
MSEEIKNLQKYLAETRLFEKRLEILLNDLNSFRKKCEKEDILNSKALKELNEFENDFINYSSTLECFEGEIKNQLNPLLEEKRWKIYKIETAEERSYMYDRI